MLPFRMFTFMMRVSRIHRCLQVIFFFPLTSLAGLFSSNGFLRAWIPLNAEWKCSHPSRKVWGREKIDTDESDVKMYVQTEGKSSKRNEHIYFDWIRFMRKSYDAKTENKKRRCENVKMSSEMESWHFVCVWWKNKLRQTCFILVAAYLHELCTLHFTLFMIQRRAQMLCQNTEKKKKE